MKPYARHGLREIEWENYWDSLIYEGIACHTGDIYSSYNYLAHQCKNTSKSNICVSYLKEWTLFPLRKVYDIISDQI